ncbi:imidazole glycerol phosphate synthase subunit HisH [Novosphingobium terrae]|uniref:imidazole glycerol phosphate synthase subunit HisH n=1 Tax=Novosphingobium terrae TaxID=2726189 RepID=UPI0019818E22|nr:imidazole glycerol phosphate synthase subunit HisH [Novosphingobium terrae]
MLALIDYGAGNLHSVANALKAAGASDVAITADPDVVAKADRVVLPGVGSFKACAEGLNAIDGLVEAMETRVLTDKVPFLGICVGMQLLATRGVEHGITQGLGWIPGEVRLLEPADTSIKIPHMGWNDVIAMPGAPLVVGGEGYFLHSYHFVPEDEAHVLARTVHGVPVVAAVGRDNIVGAQFHPEKSQKFGLDVLSRFLEWQG